ncbi:hypothetical protein EI555_015977 [Monodon monoceros]|uniref:Uncharacterized protein n=1 Tax=Monodon monoceros TaxID=40151 RepID=A0A4U1EZ00_MONMO|nr:hypothetical protein EI555_015977 [Monodon monoceros]
MISFSIASWSSVKIVLESRVVGLQFPSLHKY